MKLDPKALVELEAEDLGDHLVRLAEIARRHAAEGNVGELAEMLTDLRAGADLASGVQLLLLEVAEAFLRSLARIDLGKREVALHLFFSRHPVAADELFARFLKPESVTSADVKGFASEVRADLDELVRVGALRDEQGGLSLSPAMRPAARELFEPAALRMWWQVQRCRRDITAMKLNPERSAVHLASRLGITEEQARRYLRRSPVVRRSMHVSAHSDGAGAIGAARQGAARPSLSGWPVATSTLVMPPAVTAVTGSTEGSRQIQPFSAPLLDTIPN
jgi:hypothetical protein